jgi:DNA repair exonuclease SbcCD nuclease subunit
LQILNTPFILLGDLHFGIKKFSLDLLDNQLMFFDNQVIPYMLKRGIRQIIQVGDLFDNRTIIDIAFLQILRERFFDVLQKNNINMLVIVGNHDIAYKNTRDTTILKVIQDLYPDNFTLINDQIVIDSCGFIPWLVPGETISRDILKNSKYIFGHLECEGFEIANGVIDKHSEISTNTFQQHKNIKAVFSGHYHIPNTKGLIKYIGTPYQLNWGDSGNIHGFYDVNLGIDSYSMDFIPNNKSKQHIKIWFDNKILLIGDKLFNTPLNDEQLNNLEDFLLEENSNMDVKIYLQGYILSEHHNQTYYELISILNKYNVDPIIIDNRDEELQEAISNATSNTQVTQSQLSDTTKFISDFIEENHPDLLNILKELLDFMDKK